MPQNDNPKGMVLEVKYIWRCDLKRIERFGETPEMRKRLEREILDTK